MMVGSAILAQSHHFSWTWTMPKPQYSTYTTVNGICPQAIYYPRDHKNDFKIL